MKTRLAFDGDMLDITGSEATEPGPAVEITIDENRGVLYVTTGDGITRLRICRIVGPINVIRT